MTLTTAVSMEIRPSNEPSFFPVVVISFIVHAFVFIGIPVITKMLYHSEKYDRPRTFQLVSPSLIKAPIAPIPKSKSVAVKSHKSETTPVPAKKPVHSESKKQEETTNDLSELLESVATMKVSDIQPSQNFKYNWYIQNLQSKVEEQWKPPMGLTDKNDAEVIVSFSILQNGSLSGISVATSSGVSILDNLALRAIQLAAPFGKLPIGFSENKLDITYSLHYHK
jgi:TonB family protein